MNGYPSPKTAAKNQRRLIEKQAVGIVTKIDSTIAPVRQKGETIVATIERLVKEYQAMKPALDTTPDTNSNA